MACGATLGIGNHYHTTVEVADAQLAALAVVSTGVLGLQSQTGKYFPGPLEVESALDQRTLPLGAIVCDPHGIIVYTLNRLAKHAVRTAEPDGASR